MKAKKNGTKGFPIRTCVGCFQKHPQNELIRIVRVKQANESKEPSDRVEIKEGGGRSVYLCKKKECLNRAWKRKNKDGLSHGLKIKVDAMVIEPLWKMFTQASIPSKEKP